MRDGDKDRFLSSLFAPDAARPHILALYAFNLEIARIRSSVSEPYIGLIRQQWWLDTIDAIYSHEIPAHPVAQELARAVEVGTVPKHALRNLVIAREFDLYDDAMPNLAHLEGYLGETSSALIQLVALVLAGPEASQSAEVAGLAGVAQGLAGLLRAKDRRFLPRDLVEKLGEAGVVAHLVEHARQRLGEARALRDKIPAAALPAFLPVSLTGLYLNRPGTNRSQFRRQIAMWWAARNNRF